MNTQFFYIFISKHVTHYGTFSLQLQRCQVGLLSNLIFDVSEYTIFSRGDIMLKFRKGCIAPYPERINEEYELNDNCIIANIGADNKNLLLDFIKVHTAIFAKQ